MRRGGGHKLGGDIFIGAVYNLIHEQLEDADIGDRENATDII